MFLFAKSFYLNEVRYPKHKPGRFALVGGDFGGEAATQLLVIAAGRDKDRG